MSGLFRRKPVSELVEEALGEAEFGLRRTLGPFSLIALGIGCVIGAGLFSLTGIAAAENAGPAVVLSFVVAGIGCAAAGMCYSELASMIPISGSAYTYTYASMGEFVAWVIGWDLVLEYAVAASTVSVSWSRYVLSLLGQLGIRLPHALIASPFDPEPGVLNLPATAVIILISLLLISGIKQSSAVNAVIVVIKIAVVLAVVGFGAAYINPAHYHPFIPPNNGTFGDYGWSGVLRGASVIFFAYIGFDAVSTAAQETRNPGRDMPIGILGSLFICTVLYIAFSLVLTGIVDYRDMRGDAAPVVTAIRHTPYPWLQFLVTIGIISGLTSVILVLLLGQSRVAYAMARDGFLPRLFADIHPRFRTPWRSNLVFMVFAGALGGIAPISKLGHLTSIGTLFAFVLVCLGVLILRRAAPDQYRRYRVPFVPALPLFGAVWCFGMMTYLNHEAWIMFLIWLAIGLVLYFGWGRARIRVINAARA